MEQIPACTHVDTSKITRVENYLQDLLISDMMSDYECLLKRVDEGLNEKREQSELKKVTTLHIYIGITYTGLYTKLHWHLEQIEDQLFQASSRGALREPCH